MTDDGVLSGRRLMAVHAHPDDESSKGAATLARYAREGVATLVVTCTGGERGDVLNPHVDPAVVADDMVAVRGAELASACATLGVRQCSLGFADSGMSGVDGGPLAFAAQPLGRAVAPLVGLMRTFRPHVVLTYDETGGYPHPDHVMCHRISMAAFRAAGSTVRYRGLGTPWQPAKLYYHLGLHPARLAALRTEMAARYPHADAWRNTERLLCEHDRAIARPVTTRVPCGAQFELRERALRAHRSQIDPTGFWFTFPADVQRSAWPTEDFFLARSKVPVRLPETDLFAGLPPDADIPAVVPMLGGSTRQRVPRHTRDGEDRRQEVLRPA